MLIKLNRLAGLVGRVSFVLLWAQSARLGPARCGSFGSFPRDDSKKKKQKRIKRNEKKHARTSTKRWNQIMFLCQFRSRRLTASSTQPNTNAFIARSPPHLVPFFTAFFFFGFECAISLAQEYRLRTLLNWLIYFIFFVAVVPPAVHVVVVVAAVSFRVPKFHARWQSSIVPHYYCGKWWMPIHIQRNTGSVVEGGQPPVSSWNAGLISWVLIWNGGCDDWTRLIFSCDHPQ